MTILGMIAAIVGGALKFGMNAWEKGEDRIDKLQRLRIVFQNKSYYFEIKKIIGF